MATFAETIKGRIECGYCMEPIDQMGDPRSLPCQHSHCYQCLVGDFNTNRIVKCGTCREVFDVTLARLPRDTRKDFSLQACDSCVQKGDTDVHAVSYCPECNRKMCAKHMEFHEEFYPLHNDIINIKEYQQKAQMFGERSCAKHENSPITMGCSACYQVLCATCFDVAEKCGDGLSHQATSLKNLMNLLKMKRDEMKVEAQVKEGELATLLKDRTKILSDYKKETEKMIENLHRARDEQLSILHEKYDELEKELMDSRRTSKEQLVDFMEQEVGVRLTEINTSLLLQEAAFKDTHMVDLATNFTTTLTELQKIINEDLPSLSVPNQKLSAQDTEREIELRLVDAADVSIGRLLSPTSLNLKRVVNNVRQSLSVSQYGGVTYVGGMGAALCRVDGSDWSMATLSSVEGITNINGLHVYKDKLYILAYPWRVIVTDLNGKQITSWAHSDSDDNYNKLVVTGEKVVGPDRSRKRLTVYSLRGQVIKHIACPHGGNTALCAPDQESVVVSSTGSSTVFRVNIETGEVMWTSTAVTTPGGVACYGQEYILVTPQTSTQTEIHLLDANTGKQIGKLLDTEKRTSSRVYDLCVTGNTLIVPRYDQQSLLYYQLMSE